MNSARWMSVLCCLLLLVVSAVCKRQGTIDVMPFNKEATLPLRLILACMVIFAHLPYNFDTGTTAVSVFFFLSGYGMFKSYQKKGLDYLEFLPRREAFKLITPCFICVVIWLLGRKIYHIVQGCQYGVGNILIELNNGDFFSNIHSWFPWALLSFAIFFWLAFKFFSFKAAISIVLLGCGVYYGLLRYSVKAGQWWWVSTWSFPVGICYARFESFFIRWFQKLRWKYPLLIMMVYLVFRFGYYGLKLLLGINYQLPILSELAHNMTGVIVVTFLYVVPLPRWKTILWLSGFCYEFYVLHGMLFRMFCGFQPWYIAQVEMIMCVLLFAPLLHKLTNKIQCAATLTRS